MPEQSAVLVHLEYIREKLDAVEGHLAAQNGRLRTAETDIALLQDRASDAKRSGQTWGAGAGAAGGFFGGFVAAFLSKWMGGQ